LKAYAHEWLQQQKVLNARAGVVTADEHEKVEAKQSEENWRGLRERFRQITATN
jgi:hypothetical protein